jgi:hypothetical protein
MIRHGLAALLAALVLSPVGCTRDKASAPPPTPPVAVEAKPNFVRPTAEEAYRLQDDCSRRGDKILRENLVGSALTQGQVSRYNAVTNRCYVRLEVHAMDFSQLDQYDYSTYLKDGQTGEMLAFTRVNKGGAKSFLGFGCGEIFCVSEKIAACMSGKECEPE